LAIWGDYPDFDPKGPTVSSLTSTLRIPKELSVVPGDSRAVLHETVGRCIYFPKQKKSLHGWRLVRVLDVMPSFALGGRTASGWL